MPGTAVTKSVVANEPGGRRREEIFVDVIEKISVTFSASVSSDSPSVEALSFVYFVQVESFLWILNDHWVHDELTCVMTLCHKPHLSGR